MNLKHVVILLVSFALVCASGTALLFSNGSLPLQASAVGSTSTTTLVQEPSVSGGTALPLPVQNVRTVLGTCGSGMVVLSWDLLQTTSPNEDPYAYRVMRNGTEIYKGTNPLFSDVGLSTNTTYTYTVYAIRNTVSSPATIITIQSPAACASPSVNNAGGVTTVSSSTNTLVGSATTTPVVSNSMATTSVSRTGSSESTTTSAQTQSAVVNTGTVPVRSLPDTKPLPSASTSEMRETVNRSPLTDTSRTVGTSTPTFPQGNEKAMPRTVVRDLPLGATSTPVQPLSPETVAKVAVVQNTISSFTTVASASDQAKEELKKVVDQAIERARQNGAPETSLEKVRTTLTEKIDTQLTNQSIANGEGPKQLASEVSKKLSALPGVSNEITRAVEVITAPVAAPAPEVALLYKDSNKDGISDYDATHLFNTDPKKPLPTTVVGNTVYTPEAKALAGFDPTQKELVRIFPETPSRSTIPPTKAYTVDTVALATTTQELVLSGKALPNSFITVYIFSTPIVVTIKTDAQGAWRYTLDRELEDGAHTVQTATVDNSGRILAKSEPFPFTKTAQAAALGVTPLPAASEKPTLLSGMNFYIVFGLSTLIFFLALIYVGVDARRRSQGVGSVTVTEDASVPPPPPQ